MKEIFERRMGGIYGKWFRRGDVGKLRALYFSNFLKFSTSSTYAKWYNRHIFIVIHLIF